MAFKDLQQHFDPALKLPIGGKVYRIEPVDADTGLFLQATTAFAATIQGGGTVLPADVEQLRLDEDDPRDIMHRLLGDTLDEMKADGLDFEVIKLVTQTALIWVVQDADTAETFWNNGGSLPKARAPQDRKGPAKSARQASTGTTSPRKKKAATGGKSSSTTGS